MRRTKFKMWLGWCGAFAVVALCAPVEAQTPTVAIRNPVVRTSPRAETNANLDDLDESPLPSTLIGAEEVVNERYPNGDVRVQRHVRQDTEGNYINHGEWAMWDERGEMVGAGRFEYGLRHGKWIRWFRDASGRMFKDQALHAFEGPFVAEANFDHGKIDGKWRLFDGRKRRIAEWEFKGNDLHGKSVWWYPDGRKMRETGFLAGQLDGEWNEWNGAGAQTRADFYKNARKLAKVSNYYEGGQVRDEGLVLFPAEILEVKHDWWAGAISIQVGKKVGKAERHGPFVAWHKNGIPHWEGTYQHDMPVGKHTWWHANGQKQAQGEFVSGVKTGKWNWWFENGMKLCEGEYLAGHQNNRWVSWDEAGKVVEMMEFTVDGKATKHAVNDPVSQEPVSEVAIDSARPQPRFVLEVTPPADPNPTRRAVVEARSAPIEPPAVPTAPAAESPSLETPAEDSEKSDTVEKDDWWRLKPAGFLPLQVIKSTASNEAGEAVESGEASESVPPTIRHSGAHRAATSRRPSGGRVTK